MLWEVVTAFPILQMRKLRPSHVKWLAQGPQLVTHQLPAPPDLCSPGPQEKQAFLVLNRDKVPHLCRIKNVAGKRKCVKTITNGPFWL